MKPIFAATAAFILAVSLPFAAAGASSKVSPGTTDLWSHLPTDNLGCYRQIATGWSEVTCATPSEISAYPVPTPCPFPKGTKSWLQYCAIPAQQVSLGIESTVKANGPAKGRSLPLVFGDVKTVIGTIGSMSDSNYGAGAFSIQANTNVFSGNNGDKDWVQFVIQSAPDKTFDLACVLIWDLTTKSEQTPTCISVSRTRPNNLQPRNRPEIWAMTLPPHKLLAGFHLPWWDGVEGTHWYFMTADDTFALKPNWTDVSGSLLGLGNGSSLTFDKTQIWVRIQASTCSGDNPASKIVIIRCPNQPRFYPSAAVSNVAVSNESNNLWLAGGPPPKHLPDLNWPNADFVSMDFSLISPNAGSGGSLGSVLNCVPGDGPPCPQGYPKPKGIRYQ